MASRLLSFLTDIEQALFKESVSNMGPTWDSTRIVNYHHGLARMTLVPPKDAEPGTPSGTIFLQSFTLADGSLCLKATLHWEGCDAAPTIPVYSTPALSWKAEAARIGSAWLAGPPTSGIVNAPVEHISSLSAATG